MSGISLAEFADKVNEIMPVIAREFMKQHPGNLQNIRLTMPQFFILDYLHRVGESRMSNLAHFMNVTTAAMTGIIERLVRDGYVRRISEPGDRRIIKIGLSKKGNSIAADMIKRKRKMMIGLFGGISQTDRENYLNILIKLRNRISE